jgi:hypothetical protein
MSQLFRRIVLGFVVGLCLLTPLADAAQRPQGARVERFLLPAPSELFAGAWRLLARIWNKEGCMLDPHGACVPKSTVVPSSDAGCGIDPHGGCTGTGSSTSDNGCGLDPHGGCIGG